MTARDPERLEREIAATELKLAAASGAAAFRDRVAEEIRNAMDRAAAGVLFAKPWAAVSPTEIKQAAKSDYVAVGDARKATGRGAPRTPQCCASSPLTGSPSSGGRITSSM